MRLGKAVLGGEGGLSVWYMTILNRNLKLGLVISVKLSDHEAQVKCND